MEHKPGPEQGVSAQGVPEVSSWDGCIQLLESHQPDGTGDQSKQPFFWRIAGHRGSAPDPIERALELVGRHGCQNLSRSARRTGTAMDRSASTTIPARS